VQTEYAKPCWSAAFINNFESNERKAAGILLTVFQHCKPQRLKTLQSGVNTVPLTTLTHRVRGSDVLRRRLARSPARLCSRN